MNRPRRFCAPMFVRLVGLVAGLLALAWVAPAVAQDARAQARQAYQRGKQLFDAGDYTGAIGEFERAQGLAPSPVLDFNIGLAHDRLGHAREAVDSYRRYLRAVPDASNKSAVESRIAALEPKIVDQMQPLPPADDPVPAAPAPVDQSPGSNPPPGVAPPVEPPESAVAPEDAPPAAAPGGQVFDAPVAPSAPVQPRIPARTGDPELDRVISIDLAAVRARFRAPAAGPPRR